LSLLVVFVFVVVDDDDEDPVTTFAGAASSSDIFDLFLMPRKGSLLWIAFCKVSK